MVVLLFSGFDNVMMLLFQSLGVYNSADRQFGRNICTRSVYANGCPVTLCEYNNKKKTK